MVFDYLEDFFSSREEEIFFGWVGGGVDLRFDTVGFRKHILEHEFDEFCGIRLVQEGVIGLFFLLEEFFDGEQPIEVIAVFGKD